VSACPTPYDVRCLAHVHTTYSDGTATVEEVVEAARANDVRVVLLTDHDTLQARRDGHERWHGDVLVLVGMEVSPRGGHFLAFGLEREVAHDGRSEAEIARAVVAAGGVGFAAHPFSEGSRMSRRIGRPHPWGALEEEGTGLELWSLATDEAESWRSPVQAVRALRDPAAAAVAPPPGHLAAWDALCRRRRVPALGGLDAHQQGVRIRGRVRTPLPHARWFGLLHTHLLLERPLSGRLEPDRATVLHALREGRAYLGLASAAPAGGARVWADGPGGVVPLGGQASPGNWTLRVRLPHPARLVVVRDGSPLHEVHGAELHLPLPDGPGVVRVEAWRPARGRERAWILTNPIYLR
jgi:hypothetical protein